jgi:hypothetical protein
MDGGAIYRLYSHAVKECCSNGGHYDMIYPKSATVEQKLLLIAAVMGLDLAYYDKSGCLPPLCPF